MSSILRQRISQTKKRLIDYIKKFTQDTSSMLKKILLGYYGD